MTAPRRATTKPTSRNAASIIAARDTDPQKLSYDAVYQCAESTINQFVCKHYDVSQGDVMKDVRTGQPDREALAKYTVTRDYLANIAVAVSLGLPDQAGLENAARQFIAFSNARGAGRAEELIESLHAALTPLVSKALALRDGSATLRG